MRLDKWDVIIFQHGSQAPVQEFGITYYNEPPKVPSGPVTSMLSCFLPAKGPRDTFKVSIHCWEEHLPLDKIGVCVPPPQQVWQIQVYIAGRCVWTDFYSSNTAWPVQVVKDNVNSDQLNSRLVFPELYGPLLTHDDFDVLANAGRIKVEIWAGYVKDGSFFPVRHNGTFNFVPIELQLMKSCGVAWPHVRLTSLRFPNPFAFHATNAMRTHMARVAEDLSERLPFHLTRDLNMIRANVARRAAMLPPPPHMMPGSADPCEPITGAEIHGQRIAHPGIQPSNLAPSEYRRALQLFNLQRLAAAERAINAAQDIMQDFHNTTPPAPDGIAATPDNQRHEFKLVPEQRNNVIFSLLNPRFEMGSTSVVFPDLNTFMPPQQQQPRVNRFPCAMTYTGTDEAAAANAAIAGTTAANAIAVDDVATNATAADATATDAVATPTSTSRGSDATDEEITDQEVHSTDTDTIMGDDTDADELYE